MRMSMKYPKMKNARAKRARLLLCKFVTFLLLSSLWLLKLPVEQERGRRLLEGYLEI